MKKYKLNPGILQTCLDQLDDGQSTETILAQYPEAAEQLKSRLEAAQWLHARQAAVEPQSRFMQASRQRIVGQIRASQARLARQPLLRLVNRLQFSRTVPTAIIGALVLVMLLFVGKTAIAVAHLALPGDTLYPVKRTVEQARLAFEVSESRKAAIHIDLARERADELEALIIEGLFDQVDASAKQYELQVGKAMQTLPAIAGQNANQAQELSSTLENTLAERLTTLKILGGVVPQPTQAYVKDAIDVSERKLGEMKELYH